MKVVHAEYVTSFTDIEKKPKSDQVEIILLGRSNVGKSSFLNFFTNRKKLAYFSSKPGKTQTLNVYFINEDVTFIDAPGYGYARVSKVIRAEFGKMIENYLINAPNLKFACMLVDFKVGITEDDKLMYQYLKYLEIPTIVVATKKDKVKKNDIKKQTKKIEESLDLEESDYFYAYTNTIQSEREKLHQLFEGMINETR